MMLKKILTIIPVFFILLSCTKKEEVVRESLRVTPNTILYAADKAEQKIHIQTSEDWTIHKADTVHWVSFSKTKGSRTTDVTISLTANKQVTHRETIITIQSGEKTADISIYQYGNKFLTSSKGEINGIFAGFKDSLIVSTLGKWELSNIPDWLTISQKGGIGKDTIYLSAKEYLKETERSAALRLATQDTMLKIMVVQQGIDEEMIKPGWKLIFDDEFNTDGPFDDSKWSMKPRSDVAWRYYLVQDPDYVYQKDGNLVLRMDNKTIPGNSYPYHSAGLITSNKFNFTYGKVEVRAKFTLGQGSWPAIWMMPQEATYGGWPYSGEIDIMEHVNKEGVTYSTAHNRTHTSLPGGSSNAGSSHGFKTDDYNIYGVEWTEDALQFYVNGNKFYTYSPSNKTHSNWPYDKPFYILLNQSGGKGWPGAINDADLPFHMEVDWVRVYQKNR